MENRPALPTWTVIVLRCASIGFSWGLSRAISCAMAGKDMTGKEKKNAAKSFTVLSRIRIDLSQIAFEQFGRKHTGDHTSPARHHPIFPLPDIAHQQGTLLHMAGAVAAQRFIAVQ